MKKQFGFKPLLIFVFIFSFFAFAFTKLSVIGTFKTDAPFSSALTTASQVEVSDEGSLTEALSKLESSRADEPVTINFNLSIGAESANKTIELSSGYAIFTGKITSSVADPIFKLAPTSSENSFEFNLELSSTAEEGKDLAILLDNGEEVGNTANISFGANLKTDYKNLLNFTRWAIITIPVSTDFVTETPLGIVCPYDIGDKIIVNNYSGSYADKIKIVSTNPELYSIETQVNGGKLLVRASNVNIKFINNNGTENTKNQTFNYNSANFDFPTEVDETYDHHHFAGWFAKVQVKGSTYYVENTEDSIEALEAEETTVLKTALDEVNKENCFTSCVNNSENLCMRVLNYFLEHDLVPTFELLWEDDQYTVTYDAGDGLFDDEQHIASSSGKFGDDITPPKDPTRYGYNFAGWKLDGDDTEFDQTTFETNYNVHAEWVAKRYSIDLYSSKDDAAPWRNLTFTFGQQELSLPTDITKEGYTFSGDWYTADERLFDIYTMLDEFEETDSITKISLYADWVIRQFTITLWYGNQNYKSLKFDYNTTIDINKLPIPSTRTGYVFDNFYTDSALTRPLRSFKLTENTNLYVRFDLKYSNVYFCLGYDNDSKIIVSVGYNQPIYYPNNISRANFTFIGWYADKDLSTVFVSGIPMATEDVYVYAKWQEKQHIQIDTTSQTFSVDNLNMSFSNFSELTGFVVEYFVNGKWNTWVPASVGSYDVRITRAEDTNYASFEMILQNALIVEPQYVNITWVIAILLIVFLIEIMVCVLLKVMKKLKTNLSLSLVLLPLMSMFFDGSSGNLFINDRQAIPLVQFILLIVSAALAIAGFVFMIIFIYRLHRTAPALLFDNVPNNDLNNGFDENARQAPKDNSDDLKIKNKIDDYLSGFVTDQHGYVSQNDSETALSQVAGEENESPAEEIYNDERGGDSPSAPEENADHADE